VADNIQFEPFGPLLGLRYGNGIVQTHEYDADGRLTSTKSYDPTTGAYVQGADLTWSANNELLELTNVRGVSLNQNYSYDQLGRMLSAARGSGIAESFSYDSLGNRITQTTTGQMAQNFTYSASDDRVAATSQGRVWTYDPTGNINGFIGTDGLAVGLDYDTFGRVASSSKSGLTTAYLINGFGQRVSKAGPNGTYRYIYTPDGTLIAEFKDGAGWTDYVFGGSMLLGLLRGNALSFVHSDQVGRPEVITNSAKGTVWAASNNAFDRTVSLDQIGGMDVGFPGQYFDQETGLWHNYFRDFDASIGRYIQADPIGLGGGPNVYAYVSSNPSFSSDAKGLEGPEFALLSGGVIKELPERRGPDYVTVEFNMWQTTWSRSITRNGTVFNSGGGTSPGTGFSLQFGYLVGCPRTGDEVDKFMEGLTSSVSAYNFVGGGTAWNASGTAVEFGFGFSSPGGSASYGVETGSIGSGWHSQ
jgi:RHS repeat-associated protein